MSLSDIKKKEIKYIHKHFESEYLKESTEKMGYLIEFKYF